MARHFQIDTISRSIFALVIGAVLVATVIFFLITFRGPPPKDAPRSIDSIAFALLTGRQPGAPGTALRIATAASPPVATGDLHPDPIAAARIAAALGMPRTGVIAFDTMRPDEMRGMGGMVFGDFTFAVRTGGAWRVVRHTPGPLFKSWHWLTLGAMLAAILSLALPTWLLARAISRPISRIAATASIVHAGAPLGPMPQGGPSEVRLLTRAIERMHRHLSRHAEGRTAMLAAIAHDLGTPLSRLAFWVEHLPDDARRRAAADIEEMRAMIASVLRFARDEARGMEPARIDLGSLLDSLVEDMTMAGQPVTIAAGPRAIVRGDPAALRRLFGNLIENAIRYGQSAAVSWASAGANVAVAVDDQGPGFDPLHSERLFEPFVRGEPSRNRATGGTGLGLAIVRSIAEAHAGTVTLENHAGSGRARVVLPIDQA